MPAYILQCMLASTNVFILFCFVFFLSCSCSQAQQCMKYIPFFISCKGGHKTPRTYTLERVIKKILLWWNLYVFYFSIFTFVVEEANCDETRDFGV